MKGKPCALQKVMPSYSKFYIENLFYFYSRELTVKTISVSELPQLERKGDLGQFQKSDKNFKDSDFGGPKHGKVDATGAPHVGGNTWAGGSGGRDTAGMGGVGGPYRLDSGNPVFQVNLFVLYAIFGQA
jgi:hypothetical protein